MIGDVILFQLAEDRFNLVGRVPALNWIMFHAATGGYDVKVELDERWPRARTLQPQGLSLPDPGARTP